MAGGLFYDEGIGTDGTPRLGQYRSSTTRRESSLEASSST
jgi:hypothetical protein